MVREARGERAKNKNLIRDVRRDPGLADDVKELLCADLRRVAEIPREILGPSSSRQRYRELGHYTDALVPFLFGMWSEFQRKAGLAPTLLTRTVQRNISKTSRAQDEANYADEHIKPWDGAYNKLPTSGKPFSLQIGGDFHSRYCNPFAKRVWHDVNRLYSPDGIRYNGDLVDFPSLSTHRQMPGSFPWTAQDEVDWATALMAKDRRDNPKADMKFIIGNHDIRMALAMADKGPMYASFRSNSFAEEFKLDELEVGLVCRANFLNPSARHKKADLAENWECLCDADGVPLWTTVHGFLCGKDAPRKHLDRFMTNGINNHLHDRQMVSGGSYATGVLHWNQAPCMAHPRGVAAEYIPGPVEFAGWSCGFAWVTLFPQTRDVHVEWCQVNEEIATFRDRVWKIRQSREGLHCGDAAPMNYQTYIVAFTATGSLLCLLPARRPPVLRSRSSGPR